MSASYQWALAINPNDFVPHLNVTPHGVSRTGRGIYATPQLQTSPTIRFDAGELAAIRASLPGWLVSQNQCAHVCQVSRRTWIRWEQGDVLEVHRYGGSRQTGHVYSVTAYHGMQYLICKALQEIARHHFRPAQMNAVVAFVERNFQGVLEL